MRRALIIAMALSLSSCAEPPPAPPPPPPPAPVFQPVPVVPQEELSIQGRSAPAGPGKQSVAIFANNERVAEGVLTTASPRGTFTGKYKGHDIRADCVLTTKVDCSITVDGAPEASGSIERP